MHGTTEAKEKVTQIIFLNVRILPITYRGTDTPDLQYGENKNKEPKVDEINFNPHNRYLTENGNLVVYRIANLQEELSESYCCVHPVIDKFTFFVSCRYERRHVADNFASSRVHSFGKFGIKYIIFR